MSDDDVLLGVDGAVATVTLNRPHRLNALNGALVEALLAHLRRCHEARPRVVVLKGAGKSFCSGHDLKDGDEASGRISVEDARRGTEDLQAITRSLRALPCPVVAAVHGYAIGGGAEIALSADLVVAAEDAIFQFTESAVGLSITNGSSRTLPLAVGPFVARELVMLGERITAARAAGLGLVNRAVPAERLDAEVAAIADALVARAPLSLAAAKRLLDAGPSGSLEQAMSAETAEGAPLVLSQDAEEASRAFVEKRSPEFRGS